MWAGSYATVAPNVHAALDAAAAALPGRIDRSSGGTMMGYSNGAYFAVQIAQSEPGKWPSLVLLSMRLELDVARLLAAGVRRVVLGAGDKDAARDAMQALSGRLQEAGLPARFVSLGPGGHELPADVGLRLCDSVAWARAASATLCHEND
jgi:predicted esterase